MNKSLIATNIAIAGGMMVYGHHEFTHSPSFVYNRMRPAVVSIESIGSRVNPYDPTGDRMAVPRGKGTGFIVGPRIVTNLHVVEDAEYVAFRASENAPPLKAHIERVDPENDLALLVPDTHNERVSVPPIRLCMRRPQIGEDVLAIGNPYGLDASLSTGIISGLGRSLGNVSPDDLIQTDAAINPGNSGGPLISRRDLCVLGVNTATIPQSTGIGFAVEASKVNNLITHK